MELIDDFSRKLIPLDMNPVEMRKLIAKRFALIRKKVFRKSQTKLGGQIGISLDRLTDFETGIKTADPSIVYKLLLFLLERDIDIRLLFTEDFDIEEIPPFEDPEEKYDFNREKI